MFAKLFYQIRNKGRKVIKMSWINADFLAGFVFGIVGIFIIDRFVNWLDNWLPKLSLSNKESKKRIKDDKQYN